MGAPAGALPGGACFVVRVDGTPLRHTKYAIPLMRRTLDPPPDSFQYKNPNRKVKSVSSREASTVAERMKKSSHRPPPSPHRR